MPDLKSELKKLENLKFDDEDETPPTDAPTMNMTHRVFYFFRDNPMSTVPECSEATGIPNARVSTLAIQLMNRKLLSRTRVGAAGLFQYTATTDSIPDPTDSRKAALTKAHAAIRANAEARRLAIAKENKKIKTKDTPAPSTKTNEGFNPAVLVSGLSPFQARAVYDELRKLFGGTS